MANKAFDDFDKKKIGFGNKFRSGQGYFQRTGLDGAFKRLKDPSYGGVAKNLSSQDIDAFKKMLEAKLKSKYDYSKGLNWQDRRDMTHVLETWVRAGKITREDMADFEEIIGKLSD